MIFLIIPVVLILIIIFEFRFKKPDQIILFEKNNQVQIRKGRFYARHFNLAFPINSHSFNQKLVCETKGRLAVEVKVSSSVVASEEHINNLVRLGGWDVNAISKAAKELELIINSIVKEFISKFEIDEIGSDKTYDYLIKKLKDLSSNLGINILSLTVQSIDVADKEIEESLRKKEEARIKESSQKTIQEARIKTAQMKLEADEKILFAEHSLELKRKELAKIEEEKEFELSYKRMQEESKRKAIELENEKKELELLKDNPQLLILSPQIAKLAEASQALKNAKTVVNISPNDIDKVNEVTGVLQSFIQNVVSKYNQQDKN